MNSLEIIFLNFWTSQMFLILGLFQEYEHYGVLYNAFNMTLSLGIPVVYVTMK